MLPRHLAVVYDNQLRPETTGTYCRRALADLAEVSHLVPSELANGAPGDFDGFLRIDDGLEAPWPDHLRPAAWWAIDTHLNPDWCQRHAQSYDLVFAAQRDGAALLRGRDGPAEWLPLACDPEIHCRHQVPMRFDVAFVGNRFPGAREELLSLLARHYPQHFFGQAYFEDLARIYSAARVGFNRSVKNDLNMRVFEAMACGTLLLTNDLTENGQAELFQDGRHLATYQDADELLDKLRFYLRHPTERERLAQAGSEEVRAHHTYRHRMEVMLAALKRWRKPNLLQSGTIVSATPLPSPSPTVHADYYEFARPELLALVPTSARRILDVGCGAGRLGAALKARQECHVTGIEFQPGVAAQAREVLDEVRTGDAEALLPEMKELFDAIVCGDVLEHLREPAAVLTQLHRLLRPEGCLICSIPNVRHHTVVRGLLEGHWTYEAAGLLDATHLRFFTRREFCKLLYRAGFARSALHAVVLPGEPLPAEGEGAAVRLGPLVLQGLPPAEAGEFFAYQWLTVSHPRPQRPRGLTSIILVTWNEWPATQACLDSLRLRTDEPIEIIVVDNGSTDGTPERLAGMSDLRLIRNASNRGFPAAVNQGLAVARGDYLLLLNNDTVVTTGWLTRLLEAFDAENALGMVGPSSNRISGEQQIDVPYGPDLIGLDGFAWDLGEREGSRLEFTDRLVGFCLLLKREVYQRLGPLDERFGIGCFEDDDYCRRALQAGYRLAIARSAFVHHEGSRTFRGSGVDFAGLLQENQAKYEAKWHPNASPTDPSAPVDTSVATLANGNQSFRERFALAKLPFGTALTRCQVGLTASLIARDNVRTLIPCLTSLRPFFHQILVTDTGSQDRTAELAAQLGAEVHHFPWCDDFSAARNAALGHARGEWIFWMDTDDVIDEKCGAALRQLALGSHPDHVLGYLVQVRCPGKNGRDVTVVDHVKLFRNRPDLRFCFPIHEQILPAIRAVGGDVVKTDLFVTHAGYDHSPEGQKRKLERDFRILYRWLDTNPTHPYLLFCLGMTYVDVKQPDEAIDFLRKSIAHSGPNDSQLRKAYALLVSAYLQKGDAAAAEAACHEGLARFPDNLELRFKEGVLLHRRGQFQQALTAFHRLLEPREAEPYGSVLEGLDGVLAWQSIAGIHEDLGANAEAAQAWRQVMDLDPGSPEAWRALVRLGFVQGNLGEVQRILHELRRRPGFQVDALLLEAELAARDRRPEMVFAALNQALSAAPADPATWTEAARILFDHLGLGAAEGVLQRLVQLAPDDPSAHYNLAVALMNRQAWNEAQGHLQRTLALMPSHAAAVKRLATVDGELRGMGQSDERKVT